MRQRPQIYRSRKRYIAHFFTGIEGTGDNLRNYDAFLTVDINSQLKNNMLPFIYRK